MLKPLHFNATTLSFAWVKNVYSLGVTKGTNSGFLYTGLYDSPTSPLLSVHKSPTFTPFIHAFRTYLSTHVFTHFNLLYNHLYPQSTSPTIKKKKER